METLKRFRGVRRFTGVVVGAICLGVIVGERRLQATPDRAFEPRPPDDVLRATPMRFEEVGAQLGIDYRHQLYFPNPEAKSYLPLMAFPPAIAVADVDGDGFQDIYVVQNAPGQPNRLFHNRGGTGFTDVARDVGVDDIAKPSADSSAVFADFDRDGRLDLFQARFGCHTLFLQQPDGRFVEHPERVHACSNPKAVNVADFDGDGWLDVVLGNYYPSTDLAKVLPLNHVFGFAGANYQGGRSEILLGGPDGLRPSGARFHGLGRHMAHTTAVGVADLDGDGRPDLFLSNDYTYDQLFMNQEGRELVDQTEAKIPRREHGFSGMNSDFADFDDEGKVGLFVSNMFIPPFVTSRNVLWKPEGDHFVNVAADRGVGRCGWAWSAKFADFDNDGELDLVVVNGKARGEDVHRPEDAHRSFAFVRNTIATLPPEVRYDIDLYPKFSGFELSAFQRSCLFWNHGGHFYDVAPEAGLNDLEEGQSAALVDYDNDGRIDLVVGNMDAPLRLYHNVTPHPGHWVGLNLVGAPSLLVAYGAKVWLHRPDGKTPLRELYPANGYRGQSDPRVHFGLGALTEVPDVEVRWPDGKREHFRGLALDAYQDLRYGGGTP